CGEADRPPKSKEAGRKVAASQVKLCWTPIAAADLKSTYDYIEDRSADQAEAVINRIFASVEVLARYPNLGLIGLVEGTRELVIPGLPFVVCYRFFPKRVEILSVLHTSRKWPEAF